jgi:hypothetical protein
MPLALIAKALAVLGALSTFDARVMTALASVAVSVVSVPSVTAPV